MFLGRKSRTLQERSPGKSGRKRLQSGRRERVIDVRQIALLGLGPAGLRDAGLERQDRGGVRVRRGPAAERQQLLHVLSELALLIG